MTTFKDIKPGQRFKMDDSNSVWTKLGVMNVAGHHELDGKMILDERNHNVLALNDNLIDKPFEVVS